jgi:hypothetical protein
MKIYVSLSVDTDQTKSPSIEDPVKRAYREKQEEDEERERMNEQNQNPD